MSRAPQQTDERSARVIDVLEEQARAIENAVEDLRAVLAQIREARNDG